MFNLHERLESLKEKKKDLHSQETYIQTRIDSLKDKLEETKEMQMRLEELQAIIEKTASESSSNFQDIVAEVCSIGLKDIFGKDYKVRIEFSSRGQKNKTTEARIIMTDEEGHEFNPMTSKGGGIRDCLSFILRTTLMTTMPKDVCHVLILDEPLRDLSENLRGVGGSLIRSIADDLNIQTIISSNEKLIMESAEVSFNLDNS